MESTLESLDHPVQYWDEKTPLIFRIGLIVALIYLLAPTVIVILVAFHSGRYLSLGGQGFSVRWIADFFTSDTLFPAYLSSLGLAASAASISMIVGTMAAIFLIRVNFPGREWVHSLFLAPIMLPTLILGLALYVFYLNLDIGLSRTLPGLIIGHVLITLPFVLGTVSASLYNFDMALEESARSLGAGPIRAFMKVTLPIIRSGVLAGTLFAFIVSFGQFDISLVLSVPDFTPFPLALYSAGATTVAAAAGLFSVLLVIAVVLIISKLTNLGGWFSSGLKFH